MRNVKRKLKIAPGMFPGNVVKREFAKRRVEDGGRAASRPVCWL